MAIGIVINYWFKVNSGNLLLFHYIQRFQKAVPLLRKMPIKTSSQHERFGADAIHFKIENDKPIIILGEAKTYTSKYKFSQAFEDAITSILSTYSSHRKELYSYLHEDFLDDEMNDIAEKYINNTLDNFEVRLVCLVVYNETEQKYCTFRKMTSVNRLRKLLKSGLGILTITRLILPIILF